MKARNCIRCNIEFSTWTRQLLCNACRLLPTPSRQNRKFETFYISNAFKEFMEAHPKLVWFPKENAVMAGAGPYGWITGLDDYDGPTDPIAVGFFRSKRGANVTVTLNDDRKTVRFTSRCWAKSHRRKIRLKKWENWMSAEDLCPCTGCLAHATLQKLADTYYSDHITNDEEISNKES